MSLHSFGLAPAIFHYRPCGQLIVIAQLLKICPLGSTQAKGLTPGSEPVFMSLPTKGFVMNREPQETKAFSKDKQLCSIHQHLHSLTPSLVKTHFLTEIMWDWGRAKKRHLKQANMRGENRGNRSFNIYFSTVALDKHWKGIQRFYCLKFQFQYNFQLYKLIVFLTSNHCSVQ